MTFLRKLALVLMFGGAGCSAMRPLADTPQATRDALRDSSVVKVGSKLRLVTEEGENYVLKVTAIDTGHVAGKVLFRSEPIRVSLERVAYGEISEYSEAKTALLFASGGLVVFTIYMRRVGDRLFGTE